MGLRQYIARRILDSLVVILLILLLNFFLFYRELNEVADLSITDQLASYFRFVFIDGFRTSYEQDLMPIIIGNFPFTVFLWSAAIAVAAVLSILIGTIAAYKFRSKINIGLTIVLLSLFLIPSWWLGVVLQKCTAPLFPTAHWFSFSLWTNITPWSNPLGFTQDFLWHMILPVATLSFSIIGVYFLVVRNSMHTLIHEDFVTLLKAKGLSPRKILLKHIFRNAILPITAIAALTPLILINSSVTVERVFSLTGVGYSMYRSIIHPSGDERPVPNPSLQAIFLVLAFATVALQFFFDVAHHSLDPRLRVDGGEIDLAKKAKTFKIKGFWKRYFKKKSGVFGLAFISFLAITAILAPILPIYNPETFVNYREATPPNFQNILGTDEWGRDVLSRVIWGSRVSLFEFFSALGISLVIGCFIGLIAGYYSGKWFSYALDRVTDVFVSIPLLVFAVYFPLEPGYGKWILSVGLATWGITAKMTRSQVLTAREKAHIEAARSAGAKDRYIIFHYILPDAFPIIASSVVYTAALVISLQSTLDFFGFRRDLWSLINPVLSPPVLTWGSLISYSSAAFFAGNAWWVVVPPAICMALLGLSVVFVADSIVYALNPQLDVYTRKKQSAIMRLYLKIKKHKLTTFAVLGASILVVALIVVPTPHVRTKTQPQSHMEKWIGCWGTLTDGRSYEWNLTNLSSAVRIVVNVSSTEDLRITATTSNGEIFNSIGMLHNYTVNATGPYLHITIENPSSPSGLPATMAGDISVYHDYEVQVEYTEWLEWWKP
jgi:ABC-type dipeptide/oligopeptide/nickel transport system permease subunit